MVDQFIHNIDRWAIWVSHHDVNYRYTFGLVNLV